jgi:glycosyltransferase involved in cell wall biosynthesis
MYKNHRIAVIIPAYNEENSIAKVIGDIPSGVVDHLIVVNNNSRDDTARVAILSGAIVLDQQLQGYGNACLMGISYLQKIEVVDIVIFLDADYSDYPEYMVPMIDQIIDNDFDFVIGNRASNLREKGSMTFPQIAGNWLATSLIRIIWGYNYHDLGPFRAIRFSVLQNLQMKDKTYGWTVEMQIKAAKLKIPFTEISVPYRKRVGVSKISGTVSGTVKAGYKILWTIFKYLF